MHSESHPSLLTQINYPHYYHDNKFPSKKLPDMNIVRNIDRWVTRQKQKNILLKAKITISQFVIFDHLQKSSSSVYSPASSTSSMWASSRQDSSCPTPCKEGTLSLRGLPRSLERKATSSPSDPPWPQWRALGCGGVLELNLARMSGCITEWELSNCAPRSWQQSQGLGRGGECSCLSWGC